MPYFKVTVKGGHMGAGKSLEFVRYFEAQDMVSAFMSALTLSRMKKNPGGTGICSIEPITGTEFQAGKKRERRDPYLRRRRG